MDAVYYSNSKLKLPDQIDGKKVNCVGIVFALEGPAILIDLCFARIQIFIGGSYGYVLVPVVLNSRADPNLPVQGQVRGSGVLIGGRGFD
jgi:hypothetical protein